jgi:signal transduction histidine kinase
MAAQRRLIADAAHGLRTPLTALRLQLQALAEGPAPAQSAVVADALDVLDRATHTVTQLLALSSAAPDVVLNREPVDLAVLARATVADFHRLAQARGVDIGAEIEPGDGLDFTIEGSREQLQAMLSNLVDNALCYTPAGGRVDVRVQRGASPDEVQLTVADTGPGIPPAERMLVFDRFYRGRQGRGGASLVEGSGLGLAIVKAAADRHHATIELADGMGNDPGSPGLSVQIAFRRALSPTA